MGQEDDREKEIIKAEMEFRPVEITDKKTLKGYQKIPMTKIAGMGSMIAEMVPALRTVTSTSTIDAEGLYRCTFPTGVTGELAKFKDDSGYMGTILNNGIKGQARWNPVDSVNAVQSFTVPVSPLNLFMAAILMEIDLKIDEIKKIGEDILDYLKIKDRADQEADFDALVEIYNNFRFNMDNDKWIEARTSKLQTIMLSTSSRIKQLRAGIDKSLDKHDFVHNNQQTRQMVDKVQNDFRWYQLAVYMHCFATFLDVILIGNFNRDYLDSIRKEMNKLSSDYKKYYDECYSWLERSSNTTLEHKAIKGLADASNNADKVLRKVPIMKKSPVDKALSDANKKLKSFNKDHTDKTLKTFSKSMDSGTKQFSDEIKKISRLYSDPMEVLVDNDNVYLKLEKKSDKRNRH